MNEFFSSVHLWLPGMLAMLALTMASGFFSASETALFYLSHDEVRAFRLGRPRERLVAQLLANPDRLLTAVLFWNLVINLAYFAVSVVVAQRLSNANQPLAAGVYTVVSLSAIILLGEVLPKSLAVGFRTRLASTVSWPLAALIRVLDPVIPILHRITRSLHRAFWQEIPREAYLNADDLERAVEASELSAEIKAQETRVLHNVLDLSEIPIEEVMRPRGNYTVLRPPVELETLRSGSRAEPFVMLLDAHPDSDDVTGILLLKHLSTIPARHLESEAEDVVFVPWCATVAYTLQLLREQYCHAAVVINEYGETIGVAVEDDVLEAVLVPETSRAKRMFQREPVLEIAPGRFHVDGITTLRYLSKRLGLEYEPDPEASLTVAGLLHEELEQIPRVGDEVLWQGYRIKVIDVGPKGKMRVMVALQPQRV